MINLIISHIKPVVAVACDPTRNELLNFPHWYEYACNHDFQFLPAPGHPSDIPLVLLAVVEILLRIASLVAIGYVVFGGIKYVVSQGEPDKISEAKGTIINALAGLLISTFAIAMSVFLGNRLG